MAAVMCMLTNTEMADQARGAVMSQVLSMHSGVAKLLGEKTGHPGQLIKARMGDEHSWTGRSKDSSHKVSKHWRFNAQADGSIKCSGLAVDLQRLHGALGGGAAPQLRVRQLGRRRPEGHVRGAAQHRPVDQDGAQADEG